MIIRMGLKDPPYMQNMKVYFLGSDKKSPALLGKGVWEIFKDFI
jgi:hypothetical protein